MSIWFALPQHPASRNGPVWRSPRLRHGEASSTLTRSGRVDQDDSIARAILHGAARLPHEALAFIAMLSAEGFGREAFLVLLELPQGRLDRIDTEFAAQ